MKKAMKKVLPMMLAVMMLVAVTACGSSSEQPAAANDPEPATEAETTENAAADTAQEDQPAADDGDAEYAVILKVLSNQFWQSIKEGIEAEADRQGVKVDVYAANSEEDVEGQVTLLENAISRGYKGIIVAPISPNNLNNAIADATSKGIYVVNIDEMIDIEGLQGLGGNIYGFAGTDNIAVGSMGAQYILELMDGPGQVAIIEGKAGVATGEARKEGATEAFAADGIELVESQPADWDRTKAYDVATNYINKYPDLKGIYCCNDTMAMGALEAVRNSGKEIFVVGTDGNDDAVESVAAGELAATVAQDTAGVGARGLQMVMEAVAAGEAIDVDAQPIIESVDAILIKE